MVAWTRPDARLAILGLWFLAGGNRRPVSSLWKAYKETYAGLPRAAWLMAAAQLVNASGSMVVFFLTLYLTTKMGFSMERAGGVMSGYGLGMLAGTIVGGALADRLGAHRVQRLSLSASALCLLTLSFLSAYAAIAGAALAWGFCNAALYPANASAMADICPEALRAKGFVLSRLANNLGATVGPVLGGVLAQHDYRYLFWVDSGTCLLAAVAFLLFFPERAPERRPSKNPEALSAWWKDGTYLVILISAVAVALVFSQLFSTFAPYLRESNGLAEPSIGLLIAVNTVLIVILQMPLIHAVRRFNQAGVAAAGGAFIAAGFGLMPAGRGMAYLALTVAVWTCGEMLTFPTLSALVSLRAPARSQGKYQGLYSLSFSLGIVAGPTLGARLSQAAGWSALWEGTAFLGLFAAALLTLLARRPAARAGG